MSRILKIVVPLLLLACVLPFFIRGKDGKPLLSLDKFRAPKVALPDLSQARHLVDVAKEKVQESLPQKAVEPVTMYRWRDANGSIRLSDRPNPNGPCETVLVHPNANLLPAPKPAAAAPAQGASLALPTLTTVPLESVPKLVDDARQVRQLTDQRERTIAGQGGN